MADFAAKVRLSAAILIEINNCASQAELVEQLAFWTALPATCPLCSSALIFQARHPQKYHYYGLRCTGQPAHEVNFGQRIDDQRFFPKSNWRVAVSDNFEHSLEEEGRAALQRD